MGSNDVKLLAVVQKDEVAGFTEKAHASEMSEMNTGLRRVFL